MIKIETIDGASKIDVLGNSVFIGIKTSAKKGEMVNHGDKIIKYVSGKLEEEIIQKYFYFITYDKGVLYYEKEGDPIFYTDFKSRVQFTEAAHYFNSLQERCTSDTVLIVEMDESFNKSYYLYTKQSERKLLPKFSNLLLPDSFICSSENIVELYSSSTLGKYWSYCLDEGLKIVKNKIFSDQKLVFIPLEGGGLITLDIVTGNVKWKWRSDLDNVYYGEKGDFVYVHGGVKITILRKDNGQIINVINYSNYKELNSFRSTGVFWCFDELIVVRDAGTGEVVLFDRTSFEILGKETVDEFGIGETKSNVHLIDKYLYILGISNTVHIFKI